MDKKYLDIVLAKAIHQDSGAFLPHVSTSRVQSGATHLKRASFARVRCT
jgi:hypothetical protein